MPVHGNRRSGERHEHAEGRRTEVRFTHVGLVPGYECFDSCCAAWNFYVASSLPSLITSGSGQLNPQEGTSA